MKIFLFALSIRILFLIFFHVFPRFPVEYQDDREVKYLAQALATGRGFTNPYLPEAGLPSAWRTPLHSLLYALFYACCGGSGRSYYAIIYILNSMVSSATASGVFLIARRWLGPGIGVVSGILLAIYLPSVYYATNATCDTTLTAAALVGITAGAGWLLDRLTVPRALLWGAIVGASALVNPSVLSVAGPLGLWLVLQRRAPLARRWIAIKFAAGACLVVVSPWIVRNRIVFGENVFFRSNLGVMLAAGNRDNSSDLHGRTFMPFLEGRFDRLQAAGEAVFDRECRQAAVAWIIQHPPQFLTLTLRRFVLFWTKEVIVGQFPELTVFTTGVPFALAIGGFWLLRRHAWQTLPLWAPIIAYPLVYYVTLVEARYRFPIEPFVVVWAAVALNSLVGGCRFGNAAKS